MNAILKLALFLLCVYATGLAAYRLYKLLNGKIEGSQTIGHLIFYSLLLITANAGLFFGGLLLFVKLYDYLSA